MRTGNTGLPRQHLADLGEDGNGYPETGIGMGSFRRLISTVAVRGQIPHAWVRQVWPGGVIVTPWEVGT